MCCALFYGFNWSKWVSGTAAERLDLLPNAQEHILKQENGKERLMKAVTDLSSAFALGVPHEEAMRLRDDVGFFQTVRASLCAPHFIVYVVHPADDLFVCSIWRAVSTMQKEVSNSLGFTCGAIRAGAQPIISVSPFGSLRMCRTIQTWPAPFHWGA